MAHHRSQGVTPLDFLFFSRVAGREHGYVLRLSLADGVAHRDRPTDDGAAACTPRINGWLYGKGERGGRTCSPYASFIDNICISSYIPCVASAVERGNESVGWRNALTKGAYPDIAAGAGRQHVYGVDPPFSCSSFVHPLVQASIPVSLPHDAGAVCLRLSRQSDGSRIEKRTDRWISC